jgi:hypothetical protein
LFNNKVDPIFDIDRAFLAGFGVNPVEKILEATNEATALATCARRLLDRLGFPLNPIFLDNNDVYIYRPRRQVRQPTTTNGIDNAN